MNKYKSLLQHFQKALNLFGLSMFLIGMVSVFGFYIQKQKPKAQQQTSQKTDHTQYEFVFIANTTPSFFLNGVPVETIPQDTQRKVAKMLIAKMQKDLPKMDVSLYNLVAFFPCTNYEIDKTRPLDNFNTFYTRVVWKF